MTYGMKNGFGKAHSGSSTDRRVVPERSKGPAMQAEPARMNPASPPKSSRCVSISRAAASVA